MNYSNNPVEWTGNIQVHHTVQDPPDRSGIEWANEHDERL